MPVTQRDLAHVNDPNKEIDLMIQVGNAGIGTSRVRVNGQLREDQNGNTEFDSSFSVDLGGADDLIDGSIEIETKVTPNPAITDKSRIVSYDLTNVTFFTGKVRTLKISSDEASETFFVTITLM